MNRKMMLANSKIFRVMLYQLVDSAFAPLDSFKVDMARERPLAVVNGVKNSFRLPLWLVMCDVRRGKNDEFAGGIRVNRASHQESLE